MNANMAVYLKKALFGGFKKAEEYKKKPRVATPLLAAQVLVGKKKVAILTGAGVSAASGIPTFRGNGSIWNSSKRYAGETNPESVLTVKFFKQNPMAYWEWHYDFLKIVEEKVPNEAHMAVVKF